MSAIGLWRPLAPESEGADVEAADADVLDALDELLELDEAAADSEEEALAEAAEAEALADDPDAEAEIEAEAEAEAVVRTPVPPATANGAE
jgi:hypothetical protein